MEIDKIQQADAIAGADTKQYLPSGGGDRRAEKEKDGRSVHFLSHRIARKQDKLFLVWRHDQARPRRIGGIGRGGGFEPFMT